MIQYNKRYMANRTNTPRNNGDSQGNKSSAKRRSTTRKTTIKAVIIAVIAIIIILAIVLGMIYFTNQDLFYKIINIFTDSLIIGSKPGENPKGDLLQVNFVNVGQGDCILMKFPDGKTMIMDAGGSTLGSGISYRDSIEDAITIMDIVKFDYLLLTHTDSDHVGYMDEIINNYDVDNIYRPAFLSQSETPDGITAVVTTNAYDDFVRAARNESAKIYKNIGALKITGVEYDMDIFCPTIDQYSIAKVGTSVDAKESNIVSPISVLNYADRSIVFTGDAEGSGGNRAEELFYQDNYYDQIIDCDVLKIGHHGSKSSASMGFLEFIDPEYAVISVGDNSYGHPSKEVLDRLNKYVDLVPDKDYNGIDKVFITKNDGNILLTIGSNSDMKWTFAA